MANKVTKYQSKIRMFKKKKMKGDEGEARVFTAAHHPQALF